MAPSATERSAVSATTGEAQAERIESVVALAHEKLPGDLAPQVEEFVRQYYAGVAPEDIAALSALDAYGAALAHWQLARQRTRGETKVRVYTPTLEEHGWQSTHTVAEVVTDDMPFLVDSVSMELTRHGFGIHLVVRPVVRVHRDANGTLLEVLPAGDTSDEALQESLIHAEVDRLTEPGALDALRHDLLRVLADVRAAVDDWPAMRERARLLIADLEENPPPVDDDEVEEAQALLEWIHDDNFVFLGYREYELSRENGDDVLRARPGTGLGILRETEERPVSKSFARLSPAARRLARASTLLNLTKANSRATVHRAVYLDHVGVKQFDGSGEVVGERRFLGLYTSVAYRARPQEIPILRRRVARILERSNLIPGTHDYKSLVDILETYPRDELFQISEDELLEIAMAILHLGERKRVRLFVRRDAWERFLSCLVFVPREAYTTQTRLRIQEILQNAFGAVGADFTVQLSESALARVHFILRPANGAFPDYDVAEIERRLAETVRSWTDDLRDALVTELGEERGIALYQKYGDAFPLAYQGDFPARMAVPDVERMERIAGGDEVAMSLYRPLHDPRSDLAFKLVRAGRPILLSDVLPHLENMGVRVVDERPYEITPAGGESCWIYDFGLAHREGEEVEAERLRADFQDAFEQAWRGDAESDGFNRLVLGARLSWREIAVLRAYCKYLRQTNSPYSQGYMEEALLRNPELASLLVALFRARHDPAAKNGAREAEAEALTEQIERALDAVQSLDEDRILRSLLRLVLATLRTNYFQRDSSGELKPYLSFKLDPTRIPDLPLPRPMFEIFVYSPRTEGVHLRAGKVARGGIRWSDRREDFRTEVLGLMKAQTVKNAVIVPVGAKGGFVVKRPPAGGDRAELQKEVVACYRTLMSGMLDLTDDIVDREVVPPADVVRYDGDDTYLVVAADKGTATFSDIANGIALEYGFWLGDAFASGGSTGYDHKKMGITARGAWESVKRHFRELGLDVQETEFTVVGIGDMSGDVFGNGMLLSRTIKLVGAFDHRHVFLDPDPDPETSFAERKRLFDLPGSSWADYDPGLISEGGGVFPRTAKSIPLSPQVQRALGTEAEALTPDEVVRALLRAPVDLLWNGGVGTFVKAAAETTADVADKANDAVRVDASELRCRVVAEGGNLGFTQLARIEYAKGGGRIYTDFIDNSAGVDCSDHEVNIKILLDTVVAEGDLTERQRNEVIAEMTDEVAELVLRDNHGQTEALSLAREQAASMVDVHARLIETLEQAGRLNRELEFLPGQEAIADLKSAGGGLTTPELAVLLAYSKAVVYQELLASDVPEDPYLARDLERYFPTRLSERYRAEMERHPLRRELVATFETNSMVNRSGITFAFRVGAETGASAADITRAYTVARDVFDLRSIWAAIHALDNRVSADVQVALLLEARKLVDRATRWLLHNRRQPLDIAAAVAFFAPGAAALSRALPELLASSDRDDLVRKADELERAGVPPDVAARVAGLEPLLSALDIVEVAAATGLETEKVAAAYFAVGAKLDLQWLRERIAELPREDRWQTLARAALRDDLFASQRQLTTEVLRAHPSAPVADQIKAWESENRVVAERCQTALHDIKMGGLYNVTTLSVAIREVRSLCEPGTPLAPVTELPGDGRGRGAGAELAPAGPEPG
jgi:glutamate dehydrogenase